MLLFRCLKKQFSRNHKTRKSQKKGESLSFVTVSVHHIQSYTPNLLVIKIAFNIYDEDTHIKIILSSSAAPWQRWFQNKIWTFEKERKVFVQNKAESF